MRSVGQIYGTKQSTPGINIINPFRRTDHIGCYEASKILLGCLTLVPLRLSTSCLVLLISWLIAVPLATVGGRCHAPFFVSLARLVVRIGARLLLFCFGFFWIRVDSSRRTTSRIIVSNHRSYLDILFFLYHDCPAFVMKEEVLRVPFISTIATTVLGSITVSQLTPSRCSDAIARRVEAAPLTLGPLLVFAEGTTTNGTALLPFKSGAFVMGRPVTPVALDYPHSYFNCSHESIFMKNHLLRLCSQFFNCMTVTFLPSYIPSPAEKQTPALFARNVQQVVAAALSVPALLLPSEDASEGLSTYITYRDKLRWHGEMRAAYRQHLRCRCCCICCVSLWWPAGDLKERVDNGRDGEKDYTIL